MWVFCLVESILVALAHIEILLVALLGTDCLCVTVSEHRFLATATYNAYFSVALDGGVNVTYCVCLHFVLLANLHKYTTPTSVFLLWQPQPESLFLLYFYHAFPETFIRLPQLLYKLPLTLIETVTGTEPLCFAVVFFFAVVTSLHSITLISKLSYPLLRDLKVCSV